MRLRNKAIASALLLVLTCQVEAAAHKTQKPYKTTAAKPASAKTAKSNYHRSSKGGEAHKKPAKGKQAKATAKVGLPVLEEQVMEMSAPERARTLTMMMMLSILMPSTQMSDSATSGLPAANYSSGIAMERLKGLVAKAGMPAAAQCLDKFAGVLMDPSKNMMLSFPNGCRGLKELHTADAGATTPNSVDIAYKWAGEAVQKGLEQAKDAGYTFKARTKPVGLADAYK